MFAWLKRRKAERTRAPREPNRGKRFWITTLICAAIALAIFFWYTSARVLSEPVSLDVGPAAPEFAATLGPLVSAEFSGGNRIEPLLNGDEIFPAMLEAIRKAKRSVTLETYIWASGKISDEFIEAMTERARARVPVLVLADGMGSLKFKREDRDRLRSAGVKFVIYGREHWWQIKPNINHRTHRKILVVDGLVGFTGGMCIADEWLGAGDRPDIWRETGVRVQGPAVAQMQSEFATNWLQTTGELMEGEAFFPPLGERGSSFAQCFKSGPGEDTERARIAYLLAIASARKSIKISHAYFVPDEMAMEMLIAARERGVDVEVVVPAKNDSRFGRAASRSRWGPLLEAGVKFYRFEPAMYHCKAMIVDDVFLTIGSVNFDNRSFAINDEMNICVIDPIAVREHVKVFDRDRAQSTELTLEEFNARPFYIKAADWFCGLFRSQL